MPRAAFFAQLGMFVTPGFLEAGLCSSLRREMQSSPTIPAPILDGENQARVDENQRRTEKALVSEDIRAQLTLRVLAVKPSLSRHFGIDLESCEPLSFLIYRKGYSFGRHTDASRDPDAPTRTRRVSISVFLNGEGEEDDRESYGGGSLTFFGAATGQDNYKFPEVSLRGEEGLLIGFRSDWPHSVQPITRGVRFSIVTWFA